MTYVRCVTEMGMGVDIRGLDYTSASKRAVYDAIHHSSLNFQDLIGKSGNEMKLKVTIGIPKPNKVNGDEVLKVLPYGSKTIEVIKGGLEILNEDKKDGTLIANAIIEVSFESMIK
ncbi:MAG: hypothetical protein CL766_06530 [Chloroflexi bacterium]|nr:hypothetical protein [Chloroflexota bacterium]|tara:strand:- start:5532 stop:5879 length:348 start_codon:yes stop_codon:yes gene_type:complete